MLTGDHCLFWPAERGPSRLTTPKKPALEPAPPVRLMPLCTVRHAWYSLSLAIRIQTGLEMPVV